VIASSAPRIRGKKLELRKGNYDAMKAEEHQGDVEPDRVQPDERRHERL
jgi:hypothetical protein